MFSQRKSLARKDVVMRRTFLSLKRELEESDLTSVSDMKAHVKRRRPVARPLVKAITSSKGF